jgi:predicted Zn finger-like uncharacterized protein
VYRKVYLVCFHCKAEFYVDRMQLEANADRRCPNCMQAFDFVGLGLLAQALRNLAEAEQTLTFRLDPAQELHDLKRTFAAIWQAAQGPT